MNAAVETTSMASAGGVTFTVLCVTALVFLVWSLISLVREQRQGQKHQLRMELRTKHNASVKPQALMVERVPIKLTTVSWDPNPALFAKARTHRLWVQAPTSK